MKAIILFFFLATTTPQVLGFNGVHFKQGGQNYVNLGWSTSLNNTQPYYNTIKQTYNGETSAPVYTTVTKIKR